MTTRVTTLRIVWGCLVFGILVGGGTAWAGDKVLDKAVKNGDVEEITARMRALGRDDPAKAIAFVPAAFAKVELASGDDYYGDDKYRIFLAAIRSLSGIKGKHLAKLQSAYEKAKKWPERFVLLHAGQQNPRVDVLPWAIRGLKDEAPLVVAASARILGYSKDTKYLDALVKAMEKWESQARREKVTSGRKTVASERDGQAWLACRDALHRLTGKSYHTVTDYRNYIDSHRGRIDPDNVPPEPEGRTGVLFGLEITGRNIVFVLDISGSMLATDPPTKEQMEKLRGRTTVPGEEDKLMAELMETRRRIVRAKKELRKVVASLGDDRAFNIVVYSTEVDAWQKKSVMATEKNKEKALAFIDELQPHGITVTDEALERGFLDPAVDTIYLITDGAPTHIGVQGDAMPPDARELMQSILLYCRGVNYLRGLRLFTLGFRDAEEEWLKLLAKENHGKYHRIK